MCDPAEFGGDVVTNVVWFTGGARGDAAPLLRRRRVLYLPQLVCAVVGRGHALCAAARSRLWRDQTKY